MTKLKTEQKIWNQSCTLALNEWIYVRLHKQTGRKHLGAVKEKIHPLIWSSWTRSSTFYNHFLSFTSPKPVSLLDLNGHFPPSKLEPSHHHIHIHSDDQVKHFFFFSNNFATWATCSLCSSISCKVICSYICFWSWTSQSHHCEGDI